ncbi:hypothetical protein GOC13_07260 [Sinorhizobium meliloti]|nr:hypothetical protein [Sinorhizobium meliloti]
MKGWRQLMAKWAIRVALTRPPPKGAFALTGREAMGNNYYGAYLSDKVKSTFAIRQMNVEGVTGFIFSRKRDGAEASVPFRYFPHYTVELRHWYKDYDYLFLTPASFLLRHYLGYAVFARTLNEIRQYFYNRKSFARKDRTSLLKIVLENTIKDRSYEASSVEIMSSMYGRAWVLHPRADDLSSYYKFVLDSLVLSGDLSKGKYATSFRLTPQALSTLDKEEQDSTRHNENTKIQRRVVVLTVVLAVAAISQVAAAVWTELHPDPKEKEEVSDGLVYPLTPPPFP